MLDLKAKLAAAGLVTAADVAAAERKGRAPTSPKGQDRKASSGKPESAGDRGHQDNRGNQDNRGPSNRGNQDNRGAQPNRGNQANRGQPNRGDQAHQSNRGPDRNGPRAPSKPGLDVVALKRAGKGEAYDAIRRAVDRGRLDAVRAIPSEDAEAFHFMTATGQLSRLMLDPDIRTQLAEGSAAIVAFMSHHGLAHCVVARPLAEAVAEVFPLWLRVLKDHPGAGQQEAPKPPPEPLAAPSDAPATSQPESSQPESSAPATSQPDSSQPAPSQPASQPEPIEPPAPAQPDPAATPDLSTTSRPE